MQLAVQPPVVAESFDAGNAAQPPTSNLRLEFPGMQGVQASQAQAGTRPAGPEKSLLPTEPYASMDLAAGRGLRPADGKYGVDVSGPHPTSSRTWAGGGRADATYAHDQSASIAATAEAPPATSALQDRYAADNGTVIATAAPGVTSDAIDAEDRTKQVELLFNRKEWKDSAPIVRGMEPNLSGDKYTRIVENPFIKAEGGAAVSTLSIDVDTASYANVRQFLLQMNQLPPPDAVRIEELINYFHYDYAGPKPTEEAPFAAHVEVTGCPWAPEHRLARIGIKGREMDRNKRPQSNLVFLVDVSGSMNEPAKLPLVVYGLEQLTRELGENDHIAIVVYAGTEGLVLPSTSGSKQDTILAAHRQIAGGRFHGRRRRYSACLSNRRGQFYQGRHEPRHSVHGWRLQRRRHQHLRSSAVGRKESQGYGRVHFHAWFRPRKPQRRD